MTDTATYLREAREKRGLTLDDVAETTRIPRHYLNLMEGEGDGRLISDRLYLVHYVRQYAAHLQIEESEQLAAQFIRENNRLQGIQKDEPQHTERKSSPIVPWLLLFLLLVSVGGAYVYEPNLLTRILPEKIAATPTDTTNSETTGPTATKPPTTVSVTPITNENDGTTGPQLNSTTDDVVSVLQPEARDITPAKPELIATASVDSVETASSVASAATNATPETATPGTPAAREGQRLEIVARQKAWVRVIADGQRPQDAMLQPGDSRAWSAKKQFVLTFGNAGGVDLILNGKKLPRVGASGQVVRNYQLPR